MIVTLQIERTGTLEEVRAFVEGSEPLDIKLASRMSAYGLVRRTLARFGYHAEGKLAKGLLRAYLGKATGRSRGSLSGTAGNPATEQSGENGGRLTN